MSRSAMKVPPVAFIVARVWRWLPSWLSSHTTLACGHPVLGAHSGEVVVTVLVCPLKVHAMGSPVDVKMRCCLPGPAHTAEPPASELGLMELVAPGATARAVGFFTVNIAVSVPSPLSTRQPAAMLGLNTSNQC